MVAAAGLVDDLHLGARKRLGDHALDLAQVRHRGGDSTGTKSAPRPSRDVFRLGGVKWPSRGRWYGHEISAKGRGATFSPYGGVNWRFVASGQSLAAKSGSAG